MLKILKGTAENKYMVTWCTTAGNGTLMNHKLRMRTLSCFTLLQYSVTESLETVRLNDKIP